MNRLQSVDVRVICMVTPGIATVWLLFWPRFTKWECIIYIFQILHFGKSFHESNNRFLPINFIQLWFLYNKSSTIKNSRTLVRNFLISNIYLNESACFRNGQCWSDWNHDFLNKNLKALLVDLLKYLLKSEMENGELFNGGLNGRLSVLKEM